MSISELQILLDLNKGNEKAFLEKNCYKVNNSKWLFVDSDNGNCHLFSKNGKMLDIKMLKCINANMFYGNNRMSKIVIPSSVTSIKEMTEYPWGIEDKSVIRCES